MLLPAASTIIDHPLLSSFDREFDEGRAMTSGLDRPQAPRDLRIGSRPRPLGPTRDAHCIVLEHLRRRLCGRART